ncbi:MAG: hypothetical protein SGARI_006958, partial [Bacillariaceae sp.]
MPSDDNDSLGEVTKTKPSEGSPRRKSTKKSNKSSNKNKDNVTAANEPLDTNPIIRDTASGAPMNQRSILAGYGARGERIKHTVQDGALQMPREAWNLIKETAKETDVQASSKYSLPLIDSVLRPSVDPKITKLHVTRLEMEKVEVVQQPQVDAAMLNYMMQMGQPMPQPTVVKMLQPKATSGIITRVPEKKESSAERIRGGGGEGSEMPGSNAGGGAALPPTDPPAQEEQTENPPVIAEAAPAP